MKKKTKIMNLTNACIALGLGYKIIPLNKKIEADYLYLNEHKGVFTNKGVWLKMQDFSVDDFFSFYDEGKYVGQAEELLEKKDPQQTRIDDALDVINHKIYDLFKRVKNIEKYLEKNQPEIKTGDFTYALKLMHKGKKVTSTDWNKKSYLYLKDNCLYLDDDKPYPLYFCDIIATNWTEYYEK